MHYATAKGILSPDNGMNLYRGCQHGCIYCDSRSKCYHIDHVFEDIEVKENAIGLLEDTLRRKRTKCMLATGSMTDPYIPLEKELRMTRRALELVRRYGFGISLLTKSELVLRDIDLLQAINEKTKAVVQMTLTTRDDELCRKLEPNVCTTGARVEALKKLHDAGIPTVVWLCPILPFINDTPENIIGIIESCAGAGVSGIVCFSMGLTLREGNREYFYCALDRLFPGVKEKYIKTYGLSYEVNSPHNASLMRLFHEQCDKYGMLHDNDRIFQYLREYEVKTKEEQLCLF